MKNVTIIDCNAYLAVFVGNNIVSYNQREDFDFNFWKEIFEKAGGSVPVCCEKYADLDRLYEESDTMSDTLLEAQEKGIVE